MARYLSSRPKLHTEIGCVEFPLAVISEKSAQSCSPFGYSPFPLFRFAVSGFFPSYEAVVFQPGAAPRINMLYYSTFSRPIARRATFCLQMHGPLFLSYLPIFSEICYTMLMPARRAMFESFDPDRGESGKCSLLFHRKLKTRYEPRRFSDSGRGSLCLRKERIPLSECHSFCVGRIGNRDSDRTGRIQWKKEN